MIKQGVKTSEFWLTIVSMCLALLKQYVFPDLPQEAFYTVIAYLIGRSIVKATANKKK